MLFDSQQFVYVLEGALAPRNLYQKMSGDRSSHYLPNGNISGPDENPSGILR
jgi:hypothetical protein